MAEIPIDTTLNGMIVRTWAVVSYLSHEIWEKADVNLVEDGDFFSFIYFLGLIAPESIPSDEGDVVVAPSTPCRCSEFRARLTKSLGKFDLHEFFDDIVTMEKPSLQP